ncbi:MAG TPA: alpha/beta hydrolase [Naasia sp.]|jgi:pimeloyl-ACP methyl ester carboxylesterase
MFSAERRATPILARFTSVDGRTVRYFDAGTGRPGQPLVVLLTAAADTSLSWLPVQSELMDRARVLTYDRTGMGGTEDGAPRTLDGYVAELAGFLRSVAPRSRFVLVGHSFGGLIARVYAKRFPKKVAGLVLLDVTPEVVGGDRAAAGGFAVSSALVGALRRLAPTGLLHGLLQSALMPLYPEQRRLRAELDADAYEAWKRAVELEIRGNAVEELRSVLPVAREAAAELGADEPLGDLPVAVLTSNAYGRRWRDLHDDIAARYPGSTHEATGTRSHNIHLRHVPQVAQTVRAVLAASGRRRRPPAAPRDSATRAAQGSPVSQTPPVAPAD